MMYAFPLQVLITVVDRGKGGRKTPSAGCWATKNGKHSFFTFALRNCHTEPVR